MQRLIAILTHPKIVAMGNYLTVSGNGFLGFCASVKNFSNSWKWREQFKLAHGGRYKQNSY